MNIKTRLVGAFGISVAALVAVCCAYQQSLEQLLEARRWVEHTQIVLEKLESVASLCKDVETGERGFALTQQEAFLEPYQRALIKLPALLSQVRSLTADNQSQQRRLDQLEELEAANITFAERVVQATRMQGERSASDITGRLQGKKLMDDLRAAVDEMEAEERLLLLKRTATADHLSQLVSAGVIFCALASVLVTVLVAYAAIASFSKSMRDLQTALDKIGSGALDYRIAVDRGDEFSRIGAAFNDMAHKLKVSIEESADQLWLNQGLSRLGQMLQGERDLQSAAQKVLHEFASALGSRHGMFYAPDCRDSDGELSLLASYAHHERKSLANRFGPGQGLVGQCALEKQRIVVDNLPADYAKISSGTGEAPPASLAVVPVMFENELKAVIEQASFERFNSMQLSYLDQSAVQLGVIFNSIESAERTERLLRQEQALTEELQSQQEELTEGNRKLEALAHSLQSSEEELRQQQEELQQTNEELEERTRLMAKQNAELESKNAELESLRHAMQDKAEQLSVASRYKSQFLSNMSHELRTPLNSLLVLSKVLSENRDGNLTDRQVEFARTINAAGCDLLNLIDDVLDISKIEAGAMSIEIADEAVVDLCAEALAGFKHLSADKGLSLSFESSEDLPQVIKTDRRRLLQILKNLLSNAVKFTEKGSVTLRTQAVDAGWSRNHEILNSAERVISFSVADTGIGIAPEKQHLVFEAFQQADGTTNRKFGGTGLGLAISRELARLLGGEIALNSRPGQGSTFSLFLPLAYRHAAKLPNCKTPDSQGQSEDGLRAAASGDAAGDNGSDDRATIQSEDRVLLFVESGAEIADKLMKLARERKFKVIRVSQGRAAFALLQKFKPDAIILDGGLAEKDSWIFLDRLKRDRSKRHIPVHVLAGQEHKELARRGGALGISSGLLSDEAVLSILERIEQFVEAGKRRLLIIEDDRHQQEEMVRLIEGSDVEISAVGTGQEALALLDKNRFDCVILDIALPDMDGFELLSQIAEKPELGNLPIIVHTCRSLSSQEELVLRRNSQAIVIKGSRSQERLLDETALFLHRVESNLSEDKRKTLERLHQRDPVLSGRRVLIVDDDMRHIFAISSLLESYEVDVLHAENGRQALEILSSSENIDLLLMDVMMPGMDGLEAMRAIRKFPQRSDLPIIALTAKAMKGDREQCISAGASDYLAKPVDSDQLLSLMRVWLY